MYREMYTYIYIYRTFRGRESNVGRSLEHLTIGFVKQLHGNVGFPDIVGQQLTPYIYIDSDTDIATEIDIHVYRR